MMPGTSSDPVARRSIAGKALLLGIVPTVIASLMMTVASIGATYVLARRNLREELDAQSLVLTQTLGAAVAFDDRQVAAEILRAQRSHPGIDAICVYDAHGQLFVSNAAPDQACAPTQPPDRAIVFPRVARSIPLGSEPEGRVLLTGNFGNLSAWIRSQSTITLAALIIGFGLAVLLTRRLSVAVIGPLIQLAGAADAIARGGDYSVRATATTPDEVGQLAQSFNTMLDAVERTDRERGRVMGELAQRNAQLRRLASDLTLAEQTAREHLAQTLHDGLQQLLFSARMKIDRLAARLPPADDNRQLIAAAGHELTDAIAAARSLSMELFPRAFHEESLAAAFSWLADWMAQTYGLHVDLSVDDRAAIGQKDVRTLVLESTRELLFNVVKHAKTDRAAIDVALADDDDLRITIRDDGVGFDAAGPAADGKASNAGLGLFGIQERLALLGGHLEIHSGPGRGTQVVIVAPGAGERRSPPSAAARPRPTDAQPAVELPAIGAPPLRVLIVDDHVSVREGLRELFAEQSELSIVGEASDGVEAIAQTRALGPDVILMDISMPRMDGIDATRRIRAELPGVLIFALSTHGKGPGVHPIEEAGANGYFSKADGMRPVIEHLLALKRSRSHA